MTTNLENDKVRPIIEAIYLPPMLAEEVIFFLVVSVCLRSAG